MKKLFILIVIMLCVFCSAFVFASCDGTTGGEPSQETFTVTYDANGGQFKDGSTTVEQKVEGNTTLTAPKSPSRNGYTFAGWATSKDGDEKWDFASDKVTDKNITLFVVWVENAYYLRDFDYTSTESTCTITGVKDKTKTELVVPDCVTEIEFGAFEGCNALQSLTIPFVGADIEQTDNTHFGYIFGASEVYENEEYIPQSLKEEYIPQSLKTVIISDAATTISEEAFAYCSGLTSVTIGNGVTTIGDGAFYGCDGLTSITIPDSVTTIGDGAFDYCDGLTSITIPDSVITIGDEAFDDCDNLQYNLYEGCRYLGNNDNKYLVLIKSEDTNCTSIIINSNTKFIYSKAFENCSGLTSITIPDSVTSIGAYAFRNCNGLTSVMIPYRVTSIGERAFQGCNGLTSVTIPDNVTTIGWYAFYKCSGLTSVTIGDSVTSIGYSAFDNCSGLTSITIPDSVTTIGERAFQGCSGLTSVTIGSSVTWIGERAFRHCDELTSVEFKNPNNWQISWDRSFSSHKIIGDLSDPSTAAIYLTNTYCKYYWGRAK